MPGVSKARVWKFDDDINTDLIMPGVAFLLAEEEQVKHCFSANRPGWVDEVKPGDLIVAGRNFGVGSGRPIGKIFTRLEIDGILAETFNGLGLRNCVNYGLNALPCAGISDAFDEGDVAEVNWATGLVKNLTRGTSIQGNALPKPLLDIVDTGGVLEILKQEGLLEEG